ncbi:hypothetical protein [Chitinophaga agri]|uniref:Uncharacterized protein n=1 Tax=Chitinophaga agri TaxID=2703787 RepID=A0A6B9ZFR9_9BACT|nr:hypothetical protein [Chitinophaga agri]QHS60599.1 hypothetical protein GWR21_13650 [Chitinophaga agri]
MKMSFILVFCLSLCFACRKDKEQPDALPPVVYAGDLKFDSDPLIMFVKDTAIQDLDFIRAYMERHRSMGVFDLSAGGLLDGAKVTFDARNSELVSFKIVTAGGGVNERVFDRAKLDNTTLVFTAKNKGEVEEYDNTAFSCKSVHTLTRMYPPASECRSDQLFCSGYQHMPVIEYGDKLVLPVTCFNYFHRQNNGTCLINKTGLYDIFNPKAVEKLGEFDTLVVQRSTLTLSKQ